MSKKKIVISGISMTEGGILSILNDVLKYSNNELFNKGYDITALVHDKSMFNFENINFLEFPKAKKSWLYRLFYEYIYFYWYSRKIKIDYWLSMHDITPNVKVKNLITYCHNPSMFYKIEYKKYFWDIKFTLFCFFYKYLYKINIKKNSYVIVQQDWIRKEFIKEFGINNIIVAYPLPSENKKNNNSTLNLDKSKFTFFYPSFPRVHKNHITLFESARQIKKAGFDIEFIVTFDGSENKYSKFLYQQYKDLDNIKFIGVIPREEVDKYYRFCDCLIFPSELETWGLPLSEFRSYEKPIITSNLPYSLEVLNGFEKTILFNSNSVNDLTNKILNLINCKPNYSVISNEEPKPPFAKNWDDFFSVIL